MSRFLLLLGLCLPLSVWAQKPKAKTYQYQVDLTATTGDRVPVRLTVPPGSPDVVTFNIPQVIPGTYADYDFGRFIHNFQALDSKGQALPVEKTSPNTWQIKNAKTLTTISYEVEDTWDTSIREQFVFEVGGTNWEKDSVWVINNGAVFGYLNDWKRYTYDITITKPAGFYGSTSLTTSASSATSDKYLVSNYMDLVDAPFLYTKPDTTWINVGGAKVLVSVYSKTGRNNSKQFKDALAQTLEIQRKYLGGSLPVQKYAFLIYLNPEGVGYKSGLAGALEHSYSSLYSLFEGEAAELAEGVKDIAAHEFFHIVTPLTVHAEEIGDFDYINPKMSKHLWLYEGCTEYFAQHALAQGGVTAPPAFLNVLRQKMQQDDRFAMANIAFTDMSKRVLNPDTNRLFGNVYAKGALIAMCVDIKLRAASQGKYSLIQLLGDLGKTYGKDKSFKDEQLFDEIAKTGKLPELRDFFRKHVEGTEPLPLTEVLTLVGVTYSPEGSVKRVSLGGVGFGYNAQEQKIFVPSIRDTNNVNLKALGLKVNDIIEEVEGQALTAQNANQLLGGWATKPGPVSLTVSRKLPDGTSQRVALKANLVEVEVKEKHALTFNPNATPEQLALRKNWLNQ